MNAEYVEVPFAIHQGDARWIPPLRASTLAQLDPGYPWYREGEAEHFAIEGVGRVSAYLRRGAEIGYVGSFECQDDRPAAFGLLDRAVGWLKAREVRAIRGPVTFDTWHPYRFAIEGDDRPPFLLEPHNPPYYPAIWQAYGFRPIATYVSMRLDDPAKAAAVLEPHHKRALRSDFRFRPLDVSRLEAEIAVLHELSCAIFQDALGFVPISLDGFRQLYQGIGPLLDPGLSVIAEDVRGRPMGFLFGYPDLARAVRAMRGWSDLAAKTRFLLARRRPRTAVLKTLGVVPEARGTSLALAMAHLHHRHAARRGYRDVIHALMAESNASLRMSQLVQSRLLRRYALYEL